MSKMNGTVKFFNEEKGFGFITPDEGDRDIFVHKSQITDVIRDGDPVSFEVEKTPKGLSAINVERR